MEKYTTDERTGLRYELIGDIYYLAGDDQPEEDCQPIGIWGQRHLQYIKKEDKINAQQYQSASHRNNKQRTDLCIIITKAARIIPAANFIV